MTNHTLTADELLKIAQAAEPEYDWRVHNGFVRREASDGIYYYNPSKAIFDSINQSNAQQLRIRKYLADNMVVIVKNYDRVYAAYPLPDEAIEGAIAVHENDDICACLAVLALEEMNDG